jgi:hypothetical protein
MLDRYTAKYGIILEVPLDETVVLGPAKLVTLLQPADVSVPSFSADHQAVNAC